MYWRHNQTVNLVEKRMHSPPKWAKIYYHQIKYGSHAGWISRLFAIFNATRLSSYAVGHLGSRISFNPTWCISDGSKHPFLPLHSLQQVTAFSQHRIPPLHLGITWSILNSPVGNMLLQYWHLYSSLRYTFFRVKAGRRFWFFAFPLKQDLGE